MRRPWGEGWECDPMPFFHGIARLDEGAEAVLAEVRSIRHPLGVVIEIVFEVGDHRGAVTEFGTAGTNPGRVEAVGDGPVKHGGAGAVGDDDLLHRHAELFPNAI